MTSIDGATAHPAGQWAGAHCPSTGRSLHSAQRRGVPARALSRAVRSRSGGVPAVTAAHARAALAVTRGARVTSIDGATAHPAGLGAGAALPSSGRSLHGAQRRAVPARALYRAVRSRTGGAPAVTAAHARAALAVTRGARVTSIDGATAHPAGLGAGARCPSSATSLHSAQRRGVPARALSRAVRSRSGGASSRDCSARSRCTGSHARSAGDLHRWGHSTPSGPGGWRPPPELRHRRSIVPSAAPSRRARSIVPCRSHWRCSSRDCSARSRCTGSHARSAGDLHRWGHSTPSGPGGWRPPPELRTVAP